jgi:hypothetical protein
MRPRKFQDIQKPFANIEAYSLENRNDLLTHEQAKIITDKLNAVTKQYRPKDMVWGYAPQNGFDLALGYVINARFVPKRDPHLTVSEYHLLLNVIGLDPIGRSHPDCLTIKSGMEWRGKHTLTLNPDIFVLNMGLENIGVPFAPPPQLVMDQQAPSHARPSLKQIAEIAKKLNMLTENILPDGHVWGYDGDGMTLGTRDAKGNFAPIIAPHLTHKEFTALLVEVAADGMGHYRDGYPPLIVPGTKQSAPNGLMRLVLNTERFLITMELKKPAWRLASYVTRATSTDISPIKAAVPKAAWKESLADIAVRVWGGKQPVRTVTTPLSAPAQLDYKSGN